MVGGRERLSIGECARDETKGHDVTPFPSNNGTTTAANASNASNAGAQV